jgi:hypothetical protein
MSKKHTIHTEEFRRDAIRLLERILAITLARLTDFRNNCGRIRAITVSKCPEMSAFTAITLSTYSLPVSLVAAVFARFG